jgi:hypothetical protein
MKKWRVVFNDGTEKFVESMEQTMDQFGNLIFINHSSLTAPGQQALSVVLIVSAMQYKYFEKAQTIN